MTKRANHHKRAAALFFFDHKLSKPKTYFWAVINDRNMAYSSGYLRDLITIRNKVVATGFGETTHYEDVTPKIHARKVWKSGNKAVREGALDGVDIVIFRMRWNTVIKRDSLIVFGGKTYQVTSLEGDEQANQMEAKVQEVVQGAPAPSPSSSEL